MEQVVIDGVAYEKASKIAKQFRYTTDYVGQLCRSGKVDAKLVGRSWFVNPDTIHAHKQTRYKKKESDEQPTFTNKTYAQRAAANEDKHFLDKITWKKASYETDEAELLPQLAKPGEVEEGSVRLAVTPAGAESLTVENDEETEKFESTPLPEVSLSGTLKVASLDTYYDTEEDSVLAAKRASQQLQNPKGAIGMRRHLPVHPNRAGPKTPQKTGNDKISSKRDNRQIKGFLEKISDKGEEFERREQLMKQARRSLKHTRPQTTFTPRSVQPTAKTAGTAPVVPTPSFLVVHLSVLLSAAIIFLLFTLDSRVVSDESDSRTSLEFSPANVIDRLDL